MGQSREEKRGSGTHGSQYESSRIIAGIVLSKNATEMLERMTDTPSSPTLSELNEGFIRWIV